MTTPIAIEDSSCHSCLLKGHVCPRQRGAAALGVGALLTYDSLTCGEQGHLQAWLTRKLDTTTCNL